MPGNEPARNRNLVKITSPRRRRSRLARYMLTMIITATMITTGGFGVFPPNELTRQAAQLVSENFPLEIIESANLVLEQAAAPTLEAIDRPASTNNNPIVEFFESLVEPLLPESPAETIPTEMPSENSSTPTEKAVTITPKVNNTATKSPFPSPSITLVAPILTGTQTIASSPSATPAPTWTFIFVPPTPTKTRQPAPEDTFTPVPSATVTPTGTPTVTAVPSPVPAGHLITSVSLNGGGSSITVTGGSSVAVDYAYQVWGSSFYCPGCNFQLLWGLDDNWQTCYGWTSPSPGDYPGASGTSLASGMTVNITAPTTLGTYTIYSFAGQYPDCSAAIAAYTSSSATVAGQITVSGSCAAGLTLIHSAPFSVTDAYEARWNGTTWNFATIANWGSDTCNLPTYNNSGVDINVTARTADNICQSLTIPALGGVAWISGNNTLGQCPVELYTP